MYIEKILHTLISVVAVGALSALLSTNAYAFRTTPESTVTDIVPFGGGFDVKPTNMSGISGCPDYVRVQSGVNNLSDSDVSRYRSIVLTAHATQKGLSFLINDTDCNVYRIIFK